MTLVGKIFTVLIFVMSLVFMCFAVSVYATHRNWRDVVLRTAEETTAGEEVGLKIQLEDERVRNQELRDQRDKLDAEVEAERKAKDQAVGKLESEYGLLKGQHTELQKQYAELVEERRKAVAAMNAMQLTLKSLRDEVGKLRVDVAEAQQDRDKHYKRVVQLTDELHQSINERERLKKYELELAADLKEAMDVLRIHGLQPDPALYSGVPPQVDGLVLAVPRPDLVEISLGSDDGLTEGHKLEVYRRTGGSNTYVGRIEVIKTSFDKSACKVDPNYRKSNVQRGDRVTSKIK